MMSCAPIEAMRKFHRSVAGNCAGTSLTPGRSKPAIPTSTISRVTTALLARGRISRGYLGVGLQPVRLPEDLARGLALTQGGGLMLISVEEKGPGANGGLLLGDILITVVVSVYLLRRPASPNQG